MPQGRPELLTPVAGADGMIDWHTTHLSRDAGAPAGLDTQAFLTSFTICVLPYIGNFSRGEPRSVVVLVRQIALSLTDITFG